VWLMFAAACGFVATLAAYGRKIQAAAAAGASAPAR